MFADEEFVDLALGGRVFAGVVQHDLDHALDAGHLVVLVFVEVPGLDHAGVVGGHIHLRDRQVVRIILAQDFQQPSPFIGNQPQFVRDNVLDHGVRVC